MNVGKNRQWILNARPTGKLTGEEFRWNETSIPRESRGLCFRDKPISEQRVVKNLGTM